MNHFKILRAVLPGAEVNHIRKVVEEAGAGRTVPLGQSGYSLEEIPHLRTMLMPVQAAAEDLGAYQKLYWHSYKSVYRKMHSLNTVPLGYHQDVTILDVEPELIPKTRVVWLPLQPIDYKTPTIAISLYENDRVLDHCIDEVGYSVLADPLQQAWPMIIMVPLDQGDAVVFTGLTVHCTYALPSHTKSRASLDLRYLPTEE